jgi:site-specific recombinase XerD
MFLSKRGAVYYLWYEDPDTGKRSKVTTGATTKAEAYKFLREFDSARKEKKKQSHRYMLSQFQREYLVYAQSIHTANTYSCDKVAFEQFLRVIGDMLLHEVGVREIERFVAVKQKETSAWSARKHFSHLASAFQRAVVWKKINQNPFRDVPKPRLPEKMPAYFSKEQLAILLQSVEDADFRDLILLAVTTGMRMGEILNLRWDHIDLGRRTILVKNTTEFTTKSKRNRIVPMSDFLVSVLSKRIKSATCPYVFHRDNAPHTIDNITHRFKKYVRKAKLDDSLHFHSLRHSTASLLVQAGVPIYSVKEILGHSQLSTTLVYSHLTESHLKESINRISLPLNLLD